ncbi:MAG: exo-alpha-sialidase [Balneolaceae bacterium]|nr:exo-alpha-sialidase [Balneolaceae bacterium]MCH8548934.1 glycoside hydrolase [Balneolaceae bacterium]
MRLLKIATLLLATLLFFAACEDERQRPVYEYSFNNPADIGSRYANLFTDETGLIYMSWIMILEEDLYTIQYTTYDGEFWTMPQTVEVSTNFFVNWADFPSVVGKDGEVVAAHWLRKVDGGPYAYDVNIVFPSEEEGERWTRPITPHLDGTPTEHGFVSMQPIDHDRVLAIWLDGRETDGRGHDEYEDFSKAMTLRSAEITRNGDIERKRVIDAAVCDCCQTSMAAVEDGFIAVYRDRTEDEIRDISIVRYNLEEGEWGEPESLWDDGWEIRGCPVNGPRIVANGDRVAVAWYTEADGEPKVQVMVSADGGETFDDPVVISDQDAIGRVDLLIRDEGTVYVSWMERGDRYGYVRIRDLRGDGVLSEPRTVGITGYNRASGFPRIAETEDFLFVTWTQTEPNQRVRTARVPF